MLIDLSHKRKLFLNLRDIFYRLGKTVFGGDNMTTKELLYVEDALGHEKFFETNCRALAGQISDPELKSYVNKLVDQHKETFQNFYGLLG